MRRTTVKIGVFFTYFLMSFIYLPRGDTTQIFGTRIGKETVEVRSHTEIFLTVFGNDLPSHGYFLTTTDRCEDYNRSDIIVKKLVPLETDRVFKKAVRLHAPRGVEFAEQSMTFQICNEGAVSSNKLLLQMITRDKDDCFSMSTTLLICTVTLVISAYCSGANFAYMRMSINDMLLIVENGDEPHKTNARKIVRYRKQSNWLICTMAVMNTIVNTVFTNEISKVFKEHKYGYILRYAVPTVMIVLLAEILPQSTCNRFGLTLAAKTRHVTLLLFIICAPVAWPFSKVIDYVLGREVREIYSEEKLKALIKVQSKKMEEAAQGDILARIVDFPKKTVQDMMTPMEDAFVVSGADKLDLKFLVTLLEKGYTRVPVFEEKNRLNLHTVLNVKDLATMTIDQTSTVQQFIDTLDSARTEMRFVLATQKAEMLMQEMMKGEHHLCAVIRFTYGKYRVVGLISFEDVIEQVFGDIEDDSDKMWNSRRAGIHKDQQTLDWFRMPDAEQPIGLGVNATLRLIQSVFDICPLLVTLGYDVLRMKGLLTSRKPKQLDEDEIIKHFSNRKMLIFFDGSIIVESSRMRTYRLDANRSDFRPYIWGKSLAKRVLKERLHCLSCLDEPLGYRTQSIPPKIRALTATSYFELSENDILNGLMEPGDVGYEFYKFSAVSETALDTKEGELSSKQAMDELESTQCSPADGKPIQTTTPKRRRELFSKDLTTHVLLASLEKLTGAHKGKKSNLGQSDSLSDMSERRIASHTPNERLVTAKESLVRKGPPLKKSAAREETRPLLKDNNLKALPSKEITTIPTPKHSKLTKSENAKAKQDVKSSTDVIQSVKSQKITTHNEQDRKPSTNGKFTLLPFLKKKK